MHSAYKDKEFYIINPDGSLDGPRSDVYYTAPKSLNLKDGYDFVQVVDGKVTRAFKANEVSVKETKNG